MAIERDMFGNPQDTGQRSKYQQGINDGALAGMQTNYQVAPVDLNNPFRQQQLGQMQQLQGIASGRQQGAGELAAQRQTQNAAAQQMAMARMQRGGNSSLAARGAARNQAGIGLAGAGMSQQAALQDQMAAQGLSAQIAGQGRGQDINVQLQNMDTQLKAMGMSDQARLGYMQQLYQQQNAEQERMIKKRELDQQLMGSVIGAGGGLIGGAAMMSDERVKTDIADAGDDIDAMLDQLMPKSYVYKDQARHGVGRRAGIMAQDLERSAAGKRVVVEVPDGKALDINKAISAALASSARLNQRMRKLERKAA